MKFKDIAHLYMGVEGVAETISKFDTKIVAYNPTTDMRNGITLEQVESLKFKPILTPLSEEFLDKFGLDFAERNKFEEASSTVEAMKQIGLLVFELTAKGYDLFNLIESGQAIDKTKN